MDMYMLVRVRVQQYEHCRPSPVTTRRALSSNESRFAHCLQARMSCKASALAYILLIVDVAAETGISSLEMDYYGFATSPSSIIVIMMTLSRQCLLLVLTTLLIGMYPCTDRL